DAHVAGDTARVLGLDGAIARLPVVVVHALDDSRLRIDGALYQRSFLTKALVHARQESASAVGLARGFTICKVVGAGAVKLSVAIVLFRFLEPVGTPCNRLAVQLAICERSLAGGFTIGEPGRAAAVELSIAIVLL